MRLVYVDEAGVDFKAPVVCAAGVIVHGDKDWPEVDRRLLALIEKYVEPSAREGFVFSAKEIYHGSGYFDRRKPQWESPEHRHVILEEMAAILSGLGLRVVVGRYERGKYDAHHPPDTTMLERTNALHQMAVVDCLCQTDKWLGTHAPDELATVVHEDGTPAKTSIKRTVRMLRSPEEVARSGLSDDVRQDFSLPLRRIIDTVHFAEKADARPLQLADLCAFIFARVSAARHVPIGVLVTLLGHVTWIADSSLKTLPPYVDEEPLQS